MEMGKRALQSAANPQMFGFGSPSSSIQGNELTSGTIDRPLSELLIINYAILFTAFFTHHTLEILGWK